jgi:hypothetical protein
VLDPKVEPRLSDQKVFAAVRRVSAGDTRPITVNQVLGNLVRHRRLKLGPVRTIATRRVTAGAVSIVRMRDRKSVFPTLLTEPGFDPMPPATWPEPDLFDYGAERILVVDDAMLVDLLVNVGVHVDANAAIVAWNGYPTHVWWACRRLVTDRREVPVFVLHGSVHGATAAADRTRAFLGLSPASPVIDIGLPPDAARRIRSLRRARRLANVPADFLPPAFLYAAITRSFTAERNEAGRSVEEDDDERDDLWTELERRWRHADNEQHDNPSADDDLDGDFG